MIQVAFGGVGWRRFARIRPETWSWEIDISLPRALWRVREWENCKAWTFLFVEYSRWGYRGAIKSEARND